MPQKLKRACNQPGCPELTHDKYCPQHKKEKQQRYEQERGTSAQRGYNYQWRKYSKRFIKRNPLCVCSECAKLPVPLPAEVTDHIIPHKGDPVLFWDPNNHQPMAKACHDRKTATNDGGFGR